LTTDARLSTGSTAISRQITIPAADTRLYAVDAPGGTPPLLFLSGGFGTVQNWSRVIRRLDGKYRTVRFDARARGKSGRSADYSIQAAVDDIGRVIDATGIERPILVGWSHGATLAVRYAAQYPGTRLRGAGMPDRVRGRDRSPLGCHRGRDARRRDRGRHPRVFLTSVRPLDAYREPPR
jgi:pimeloyl-ACP methyl ester carboxylesterase